MNKIKFLKKGIRVNGEYHQVRYSKGNYTPESGLPEGTITIYARSYREIPPCGLEIKNGSDYQTDYHEKDRIHIRPDHPLYSEVLKMVA